MNWVRLQNDAASQRLPRSRLVFSVVDLHALTMLPPASDLRAQSRSTIATLIACGIDPKKCVLFLQSQVNTLSSPWCYEFLDCFAVLLYGARLLCLMSVIVSFRQVSGHSELAWLLSCVTPHAWLNRMVQFKEKSAQLAAGSTSRTPSQGLFSYPVLMAADMLLYKYGGDIAIANIPQCL